ncbi:MAG: 4Fe-4S binding protein, partial [candidate division WOR-3 bacterium]|nr:4Fe-4S binding protein [candidate division WOR-3 bacterium]
MRPFRISQIIFTILINSYILVFFEKALIYTGYLKGFLVPILNCWSMPTTWFSCPLGAYQHFIQIREFPFYTLGLFFIVGAFVGRMACGFLCPFGLFQDLIFKISKKKISLPKISPLFTIILFLSSYFLIWLKFNYLSLTIKIIIILTLTIIGLILDIF